MNLGRFHSAISELSNDVEEDKVALHLASLQTALQTSISQPTELNATAFKEQYSALREVLENAAINTTFPTRKKIYEELGSLKVSGTGLLKRIDLAISENQITPANALTQIQKISNEVVEYFGRLKIIDTEFTSLRIEYDALDDGQFEIGFSIPRDMTDSTLESLEKEFKEINFTLKTFQEIAGDANGSPLVGAISTSEWQVFLESYPGTAACVSLALERVVALYKNNLEIKLLKKQLDEKNLPEAVIKPLQDHIETTVKSEIRKIGDEIVDEHFKGDEGRKNELKTMISKALRYIADRIDRGATIEVHAEPPANPKLEKAIDENGTTTQPTQAELEEYKSKKELADLVNQRMISISSISREDGPTLFLDYDKDTKSDK